MNKLAKNTYLYHLQQQHPWMYRVCCCIILGYLFVNIVKVEVPPLFLFTMYSVPEHVNDTQEIYSVLLDGNEWKAQSYIQHHSNITFYYTVLFYDQCLKAGYQAADGVKFKKWAQEHSLPILSDWAEKAYADVHAIDHYPDWLYSYFKKYSGRDFESMEVRKITVAFDGNRFHPIKEEPLFKIDELE